MNLILKFDFRGNREFEKDRFAPHFSFARHKFSIFFVLTFFCICSIIKKQDFFIK